MRRDLTWGNKLMVAKAVRRWWLIHADQSGPNEFNEEDDITERTSVTEAMALRAAFRTS